MRFGIPFALYTLVIWPVLEWALLEPYLHRGSYWAWFTDDDPILDNGPMWFVGVLLAVLPGAGGLAPLSARRLPSAASRPARPTWSRSPWWSAQ